MSTRPAEIQISETEFDAAVAALTRFDPADWQDGYLSPEEIVGTICDVLRVQVRKDVTAPVSSEAIQRFSLTCAMLGSFLG